MSVTDDLIYCSISLKIISISYLESKCYFIMYTCTDCNLGVLSYCYLDVKKDKMSLELLVQSKQSKSYVY